MDISWPKSHEQRMNWLYGLSFKVYFGGQNEDKLLQLIKEVTTGSVTPSQIEEQKFLANCFK